MRNRQINSGNGKSTIMGKGLRVKPLIGVEKATNGEHFVRRRGSLEAKPMDRNRQSFNLNKVILLLDFDYSILSYLI